MKPRLRAVSGAQLGARSAGLSPIWSNGTCGNFCIRKLYVGFPAEFMSDIASNRTQRASRSSNRLSPSLNEALGRLRGPCLLLATLACFTVLFGSSLDNFAGGAGPVHDTLTRAMRNPVCQGQESNKQRAGIALSATMVTCAEQCFISTCTLRIHVSRY